MGGRSNNGRCATNLAFRLDQFCLIQPCAAILALISPRLGILAVRAGPFDVPVGKEHLVLLTIQLLLLFLLQNALPMQFREEFL